MLSFSQLMQIELLAILTGAQTNTATAAVDTAGSGGLAFVVTGGTTSTIVALRGHDVLASLAASDPIESAPTVDIAMAASGTQLKVLAINETRFRYYAITVTSTGALDIHITTIKYNNRSTWRGALYPDPTETEILEVACL